jgi:hypothetical protein
MTTRDKEEGRRERGKGKATEPKSEPTTPTTLDRMKALTRRLLAVPKAEIDERERAAKSRQGVD